MSYLLRRGFGTLTKLKKYIKIGDTTLNQKKILKAHFRNSYLWIWNPYILEITYNKPWTQVLWVRSGKVTYPVTYHYETTEYKWKFQKPSDFRDIINQMAEEEIEFTNTTT